MLCENLLKSSKKNMAVMFEKSVCGAFARIKSEAIGKLIIRFFVIKIVIGLGFIVQMLTSVALLRAVTINCYNCSLFGSNYVRIMCSFAFQQFQIATELH
jgi:hypothetical protein